MANGNGNTWISWRWVTVTTIGVLSAAALAWVGSLTATLNNYSDRLARIEQDHVHMTQEIHALKDFANRGGRYTADDGATLERRVDALQQRLAIIEDRLQR